MLHKLQLQYLVHYKQLIIDPFTTANGSQTITVNDPLHGLANGATINISGSNSIEGINATDINGSRTITVLNEDSYTFTAGGSTNASNTAGGGAAVFIKCKSSKYKMERTNYSSIRGYPASSTFHDGRLWFGGSSVTRFCMGIKGR